MNAEHIRKVLRDIHSRVPASLKKNVVRETPATPVMRKVLEEAIETESISEEKRAHFKALLESGDFSKVRVNEDKKIAKLIDEFITREIKKEQKKGNLPSRAQLKKILNEKSNNQGD